MSTRIAPLVGAALLLVAATSVANAAANLTVTTDTTYVVTNANSGKCADLRFDSTQNGTAVQQYTCNNTDAQRWKFTDAANGYFQIGHGTTPGAVWDDTNVSPNDGAPIQVWASSGGNNQQWQPVLETGTTYHLVNRFSAKCLEVPNSSTADGQQLQQSTCNNSAAQSFTLTPADGSIASRTGYTVTNVNSGKCEDARAAITTNGTAVQQYACNNTNAQHWTFTASSDGYFTIANTSAPGQVWDDTNVSPDDRAPIQLWLSGGGSNQQWQPVLETGNTYHFVNRFSGKCLDVPGASTADSQQLDQFTCNNTGAQSFTITPDAATAGDPDFGPNVLIFDASMSSSSIQRQIDAVYSQQKANQFGSQRYALLFKPGAYNNAVPVGFYTQVAGLGQSPTDTTIDGGGVFADASWFNGNATQNFWRSANNLTDHPFGGTMKWAVSQASPIRRMHVKGNVVLDDNGGWSSGGFMSDSKVDGQVNSGTQQQWLARNDVFGASWAGANWNMVFIGDANAPAQSFPNPRDTTVAQTPSVAEAPFLYVDPSGGYQVFVPADQSNSQGVTWDNGGTPGTSLPISTFYITKPTDTVDTINAALASGLNLLLTPGVYHLTGTIQVTRPDTVVLGLGLATLEADNGVIAMSTADVGGIRIAGLLFDAGTSNSPALLQIGPSGSVADNSADPSILSDIYSRIGGAAVGNASVSVQINSNDVIGDNLWLWRADHGSGVGWTTNTAQNGLMVNGSNVTMYGLAAEHFQQYAVLWNGDGGRTFFLQNELPYDPPDQASWMNGSTRGYAAYKVADNVTSHDAWGLGVYCFFNADPSTVADNAVEVPTAAGVNLHDLVTVSIGGKGTISHIVNGSAGPSNSASNLASLTGYSTGNAASTANFVVSESQFGQMFPNRNAFYTYSGLLQAMNSYPAFANTGSSEVQKQEAAAFLANVSHETGGLQYVKELNTANYPTYCDGAQPYGCPAGQAAYYGRGPLQLSWNFNYKAAGDALSIDLLGNPWLVENSASVSWQTALWFWNTQDGAGSMSPHTAMVSGAGFGQTIRSINGDLECNGANPAEAQDRVNAYQSFTGILEVSPGSNLSC
jgi:predicted chitinase